MAKLVVFTVALTAPRHLHRLAPDLVAVGLELGPAGPLPRLGRGCRPAAQGSAGHARHPGGLLDVAGEPQHAEGFVL